MGTPTSASPSSPVGQRASAPSYVAREGGRARQGKRPRLQPSHAGARAARPGPPRLQQRKAAIETGEGALAAATPRRDQDGPLCSQSAVQGHGSLSFFPIGGRQLPWLLSGKGSRSIFTARERPSPGSLGTGRSPQDCKGPPQPLFRVPALRRAGDGQRAAQTPLQRARLKVPPRSRVACLSSAAIPSQQERPALRPASPTHWASILRWCPPGGRRVPWSPRRWRR